MTLVKQSSVLMLCALNFMKSCSVHSYVHAAGKCQCNRDWGVWQAQIRGWGPPSAACACHGGPRSTSHQHHVGGRPATAQRHRGGSEHQRHQGGHFQSHRVSRQQVLNHLRVPNIVPSNSEYVTWHDKNGACGTVERRNKNSQKRLRTVTLTFSPCLLLYAGLVGSM